VSTVYFFFLQSHMSTSQIEGVNKRIYIKYNIVNINITTSGIAAGDWSPIMHVPLSSKSAT
jgi:hypothetical protein